MTNIESDTQEDIDEYNANIRDFRFIDTLAHIYIGFFILLVANFIHSILIGINKFIPIPVTSVEFNVHMVLVIAVLLIPQIVLVWKYIYSQENIDRRVIPAWAYIHFIHSKKTINHIVFLRELKKDMLLYEFIKKLASSIGRINFIEYKNYPHIEWYKRPIILHTLHLFFLRVYFLSFLLIYIVLPPSSTGIFITSYLYKIGFFYSYNIDFSDIINYSLLFAIIFIAVLTPYFFIPLFNDRHTFELSVDSILYDQSTQNVFLFRRWIFFMLALITLIPIGIAIPFMIYEDSIDILKGILPDRYVANKIGSPAYKNTLFLIISGLINIFTVKFFRDLFYLFFGFIKKI